MYVRNLTVIFIVKAYSIYCKRREKIMVLLSNVLKQLSKVGYHAGIFQRSEVKELCNVLHEDEQIIQATNGHYEGGFSLLVATDHRLILDRKSTRLNSSHLG